MLWTRILLVEEGNSRNSFIGRNSYLVFPGLLWAPGASLGRRSVLDVFRRRVVVRSSRSGSEAPPRTDLGASPPKSVRGRASLLVLARNGLAVVRFCGFGARSWRRELYRSWSRWYSRRRRCRMRTGIHPRRGAVDGVGLCSVPRSVTRRSKGGEDRGGEVRCGKRRATQRRWNNPGTRTPQSGCGNRVTDAGGRRHGSFSFVRPILPLGQHLLDTCIDRRSLYLSSIIAAIELQALFRVKFPEKGRCCILLSYRCCTRTNHLYCGLSIMRLNKCAGASSCWTLAPEKPRTNDPTLNDPNLCLPDFEYRDPFQFRSA